MDEVRRLNVDQARLRPHLRDRAQRESDQARIFRREHAGAEGAGIDTTARWKTPAGDDRQRLRGLPCSARDVQGAMPGTNPVLELLAKERRRR